MESFLKKQERFNKTAKESIHFPTLRDFETFNTIAVFKISIRMQVTINKLK